MGPIKIKREDWCLKVNKEYYFCDIDLAMLDIFGRNQIKELS